jgi:SAM-dependent methyltransferase
MTVFGSEYWDERYASMPSVWGAEPNRWVAEQLAELAPGTAVDLACGEGRNAVWLAGRGWRVYAVDFSAVALEKGRELERRNPPRVAISWFVGDVTEFVSPEPVDLALICYLQVPATARRTTVRNAAESLAPGGTLLMIGHDSRNLTDGAGGPQDPAVLFTAGEVAEDLSGIEMTIQQAGEVLRPVPGADRPAIDALFRATRATTAT